LRAVPPERCNTQATPAEVVADTYSPFPPAFLAIARALEAEPWCLSAGWGMVQPWLRVDEFGSTILVVVADEADSPRAAAAAERLAQQLWEARRTFLPTAASLVPYEDAVASAAATPGRW
jgi:microcystin degradation protein MlrC